MESCNSEFLQFDDATLLPLLTGTPVVDACVRMGSHYVDITGMALACMCSRRSACIDSVTFEHGSSTLPHHTAVLSAFVAQARFRGWRGSSRHTMTKQRRRA